ncbi:Hsp20/alpha crystallin family protein [Streptomyces hyaluromycini]|uniref:Hsp20/alpha crystallin family protein n=1 Tax=Streptomyces hyaluromycini TaxID=1377993 RepID=UPI001FEB4C2E|nr:Hsp20/alpha crystallin family protein [Streptomyces hyaluromycini]
MRPIAAEFEELVERMNRLLQGAAAVPAAALAWSPAADMPETDDAYVLEAELPGIRRDDIEMSERELRISGEYKEREREGVLRRTTRRADRFEYQTLLPIVPRRRRSVRPCTRCDRMLLPRVRTAAAALRA